MVEIGVKRTVNVTGFTVSVNNSSKQKWTIMDNLTEPSKSPDLNRLDWFFSQDKDGAKSDRANACDAKTYTALWSRDFIRPVPDWSVYLRGRRAGSPVRFDVTYIIHNGNGKCDGRLQSNVATTRTGDLATFCKPILLVNKGFLT